MREHDKMPTLSSFIQYSIESPSHHREEKKEIQIGKEEIKLSLSADDTILYIENPKNTTKNKFTRTHQWIQ